MKVSDFDFDLPGELIAQAPPKNRDDARMLVIGDKGRGTRDGGRGTRDEGIKDFVKYIRPGDVVVFNNSKVIPCRFSAIDSAGREYEITLHTFDENNYWGLCKNFNRLRVGDALRIVGADAAANVADKNDDSGIKLIFDSKLPPAALLDRVGKMPLPPYMKRPEVEADRERYQTVYARPAGSMAAPTAGLHFTPELLRKIEDAGAKIVNITLHVGAGTWMPIKTDDTADHKMHSEYGAITPEQAAIISAAKRVVAVGTTSLRLLESAAAERLFTKDALRRRRNSSAQSAESEFYKNSLRRVAAFDGSTDIFITPGYRFKVVDVLLTNFHLPKSTLFMLVCAFAGTDVMKAAYAHAIASRYRFFSYGDCCLLFDSAKT